MHACTEQRKRMLMDDTAVAAAALGQDEIEAKTPATKHSFRGKKSLEAINIIYESVLPCPSFSFHHAIAQCSGRPTLSLIQLATYLTVNSMIWNERLIFINFGKKLENRY